MGTHSQGSFVITATFTNATIKRARNKMPLGVMAQWATAPRRQARDDASILIGIIQKRAGPPSPASARSLCPDGIIGIITAMVPRSRQRSDCG